MLKDLKKRALRGLLDKLLDGHAERRALETQPERSRGMTAHAAH
ncbi:MULTISPECIES: hypothetical protein [Pseudomonas]|nr:MULTISPECIES: hypothetical protein [Pseudomonas]TCQ87217.1 hypothetical protein EC839_107188 [Pseudomonas sp. JUb52]